ncbi:MAG: hypothetical protein ACI9XC_001958 [Gammaproteobacteria bacterium]|jgi:hypothetical protein
MKNSSYLKYREQLIEKSKDVPNFNHLDKIYTNNILSLRKNHATEIGMKTTMSKRT